MTMTARPQSADVVAGLVDDGTALSVAKVAVREASRRGARVRFLQAQHLAMNTDQRARADRAVFAAALRALREAPRVPVTFEVVEGEDEGELFVQRSTNACVLVIGAGDADGVSDYCLAHARCDVVTVNGSGETRRTITV